MNIKLSISLLIVTSLFVAIPIASGEDQRPYTVTNGKFDLYTHVGWKVFNMSCYGCHGVDATGTDIAPDLTVSLKTMTKNQFITKVLTRYRITIGANQIIGTDQTALMDAMMEEVLKQERAEQGEIIMPAWSKSPYVAPHVEDLYTYLKARSDGVLGIGEPEVTKE